MRVVARLKRMLHLRRSRLDRGRSSRPHGLLVLRPRGLSTVGKWSACEIGKFLGVEGARGGRWQGMQSIAHVWGGHIIHTAAHMWQEGRICSRERHRPRDAQCQRRGQGKRDEGVARHIPGPWPAGEGGAPQELGVLGDGRRRCRARGGAHMTSERFISSEEIPNRPCAMEPPPPEI